MSQEWPVDTLYPQYAEARRQGDREEMGRVTLAVEKEAKHIATHLWGGEDQGFYPALRHEVHVRNWDRLPDIVEDTLENYRPGGGAKFSTYLMRSIMLESKKSYTFCLTDKRRINIHQVPLTRDVNNTEDYSPAPETEDPELLPAMLDALRERRDKKPIPMRCYLDYYLVEGKEFTQLGLEHGIACVTARNYVIQTSSAIRELLQPLYDSYIDEDSPTADRDAEIFARTLFAAMKQVRQEPLQGTEKPLTPGEKKLASAMSAVLRQAQEDDPAHMQYYLAHYVEGKTYKTIGKENGIAESTLFHSVAKFSAPIRESVGLLRREFAADEKMFDRSLKAAMAEVSRELAQTADISGADDTPPESTLSVAVKKTARRALVPA